MRVLVSCILPIFNIASLKQPYSQHCIISLLSSPSRGSFLCRHMEAHKNSLLPRFLGLIELELHTEGRPKYNLVVMTNFFAGTLAIHRRFDLKGSTQNRSASAHEKSKGDKAILKDSDWCDHGHKIRLSTKPACDEFVEALHNDSAFLCAHDLLDYSLLVGLHFKDRAKAEGEETREREEYMHVRRIDDDRGSTYVGIVDILQPYNAQKVLETFCCGTLCCGRDISSQAPRFYARRFRSFLESQTEPIEGPSHVTM